MGALGTSEVHMFLAFDPVLSYLHSLGRYSIRTAGFVSHITGCNLLLLLHRYYFPSVSVPDGTKGKTHVLLASRENFLF